GSNCSDFIPVSGGSNLSDDGSCGLRAAGDIENSTAINLDELKDNGGPTHTVLPLEGSDAIGNADCAASTDTDQRGVIRPRARCERGSVELREVPVQIVSVAARGGLEGQPVPGVAVGSGRAGSTLSYAFDCAADGSYAVPGESYAIDETSASYGLASCAFPDDGEYPVGVQICMAEPALCHTAEFIVQVRNVAPTIEHIALDEPIIPGQPVTLTV